MLKIGITGGIGAGKSTISKLFTLFCDVPIYDSDYYSKKLLSENTELISSVINLLGKESYIKGKLNTSYVSQLIFNSNSLKEKMQNIIYPYLWSNFLDFCIKNKDKDYVLFESAILADTDLYKKFDKNIVVTTDKELRVKRLISYRGFTEEDALSRINSQTSEKERLKISDYIISNNLNIEDDYSGNKLEKIIRQINDKIKYISYGSRNNQEQS